MAFRNAAFVAEIRERQHDEIFAPSHDHGRFFGRVRAVRRFCRDHLHVSTHRPAAGERADGLPIVEYGRTQLVHVPTADAWAKSRMRQRNPVRRGRAA